MEQWQIQQDTFSADDLQTHETVFTTGNGYLSTRGAFEEGYPGEQPATLLHGVFDDIPIFFTELANTPNWIDFNIYLDGVRFSLAQGELLSFRRTLHLENGLHNRQVVWRSPQGTTLEISFDRFASLSAEHLLALHVRVKSVDFRGRIELRAGLPGQMDNNAWLHWNWVDQGPTGPQSAFLHLKTRASGIHLCEAMRLEVEAPPGVSPAYAVWDSRWNPTLVAELPLKPGEQMSAFKLVSVYTDRDTRDPQAAALAELESAARQGYPALLAAQRAAWDGEWLACDIHIEGDDEADRALRYSLFQLLIAAPRYDERVSIAAKSLSGFGYRGHVFWDTEIFVLPFFTYTRPEIARNLLMYRYHTLPGAREKARHAGFEGAMYAWESAATGAENTPRWVPIDGGGSELVRIWCGDIEHHISADVAYAIYQYWQVTGDDDFFCNYGAEMVLDTARFWGTRAEWNPDKARFEINDVIGPDEYHDHVDNNAYTNHMARWNLQTALQVLDWLRRSHPQKAAELEARLDLSPARLAHWRDVIEQIYLGKSPQGGLSPHLYEQFEGFFQRKFIDQESYEPRGISMQALLGIQGAQEWQYIKQPDVLMMIYLLEDRFNRDALLANWDYYTPRTDLSYGSSLGPGIQAALAARARIGDVGMAYRHFRHASQTDLQDVRGNTAHGFHAATAGGLWQAAALGFAGLRAGENGLQAHPNLPEHWKRLKHQVYHRGQREVFDMRGGSAAKTSPGPVLPILGAIFDLDGVLTDTSEHHYLAWKRLADEEGLPFDRDGNEALRGVPRRESLLLLLKGRQLSEDRMQAWMERKNRYYLESIDGLGEGDLLPGALQLLNELRAAGVKIGIASSSKNARQVVGRLKLGDLVDQVADGLSVERHKPAPDLFLHAARQLDLPAGQCLVFEDAQAGVQAAVAAGMWVAGVGPPMRVGGAHLILPGFQDIAWQELVSRFQHVHIYPRV